MINAQKQRNKPRGKPFAPGNEHRFKPGVSGNPSGLPVGTPRLSTAYQKLLGAGARSRLPVETIADRIAAAVIEKAMEGDVRAAIEVADRSEGKATQPVAGAYDGPMPMVVKFCWVKRGLGGEEIEVDEDPDKIPA